MCASLAVPLLPRKWLPSAEFAANAYSRLPRELGVLDDESSLLRSEDTPRDLLTLWMRGNLRDDGTEMFVQQVTLLQVLLLLGRLEDGTTGADRAATSR